MKIIAITKPGRKHTPEKMELHFKQELRQFWELYLKGIIREFYYRADQPGVVLILECKDVAEAKMHIDQLIFVKEELIEVIAYYPLAPFKVLEKLFEES